MGIMTTFKRPTLESPTHPLRPSQIKCDEALNVKHGSSIARGAASPVGMRLSVIEASPYGTSKVSYKIVPHCHQGKRRKG